MTLSSWHQTAVINLTGITYSNNIFLQGGKKHLSYLSLSFTSLKMPPVFSFLSSLIFHIPLNCLFIALTLQITVTPSSYLSSLGSPQSNTQHWRALENIPLFLSLRPSLCFCLLVCVFVSAQCICFVFIVSQFNKQSSFCWFAGTGYKVKENVAIDKLSRP